MPRVSSLVLATCLLILVPISGSRRVRRRRRHSATATTLRIASRSIGDVATCTPYCTQCNDAAGRRNLQADARVVLFLPEPRLSAAARQFLMTARRTGRLLSGER